MCQNKNTQSENFNVEIINNDNNVEIFGNNDYIIENLDNDDYIVYGEPINIMDIIKAVA